MIDSLQSCTTERPPQERPPQEISAGTHDVVPCEPGQRAPEMDGLVSPFPSSPTPGPLSISSEQTQTTSAEYSDACRDAASEPGYHDTTAPRDTSGSDAGTRFLACSETLPAGGMAPASPTSRSEADALDGGPQCPSPAGAAHGGLDATRNTQHVPDLTDHQRSEADRKLKWLRIAADLIRGGLSETKTAERIGVPGSSFSVQLSALRKAGFDVTELPGEHDALSPEQYEALLRVLAPGRTTGAPVKFPLSKNESLVLRGIVLARSTENATHFALAVEEFANHPACSQSIRELIHAELDRAARLRRLPNWPTSIRRAGMPTIQEAAWFRGPKHAIEVEQVDRRGDFWIDIDGQRIPWKPHTIWEADDASDNEPRRSIDPDTGRPVLTRQALWTQDVFSAALLGFTQVARSHDSYRIEDVAEHMLNCVSLYGWPDFMRLEMGEIWNGRFFHGFVPTDPGTTHVLTGWPEKEPWGGLAPCCIVKNVHKSKGKGGIEGAFNLEQAMAAHASLDIGRERGEFEEASRALIRSNRTGQIDQRFWSMDLSPDVMARIAERFNLRPKSRRNFGRDLVAPADLLRNAKGRPLLPSDHWRFCPIKRVATVRGGHVELSVENYPRSFRFRVNGVDDHLHLDHGYTVLVAFHPGRPHAGCWIFNAEFGVRNRDGFSRAEKLILAPHAQDVPQIDLSNAGGFGPRKKANAAVRRSFRAISQAMKHDYAQDSNGRELTVTTNGHTCTVEANAPNAGPPTAGPVTVHAKRPQDDDDDFYRQCIADRD